MGWYRRKKQRKEAWNNKFAEYNPVAESEIDVSSEKGEEENDIWLKIQMYIISLWLLFLLLILMTVQPLDFERIEGDLSFLNKLGAIVRENRLPVFCFGLMLLGYIFLKCLNHRWKGTRILSVQIKEVKSKNFEYLTFFTTYIIPLICFDFSHVRNVLLLFILLAVIGVIFVMSDFYLGNPTLALMGYRLYKIQVRIDGNESERLVITKDKIKKDDYVEYIPFDNNAWYVRRR